MSKHLDVDLERLHRSVLRMAGYVEDAVVTAATALRARDPDEATETVRSSAPKPLATLSSVTEPLLDRRHMLLRSLMDPRPRAVSRIGVRPDPTYGRLRMRSVFSSCMATVRILFCPV